jgi:hypothetical protein
MHPHRCVIALVAVVATVAATPTKMEDHVSTAHDSYEMQLPEMEWAPGHMTTDEDVHRWLTTHDGHDNELANHQVSDNAGTVKHEEQHDGNLHATGLTPVKTEEQQQALWSGSILDDPFSLHGFAGKHESKAGATAHLPIDSKPTDNTDSQHSGHDANHHDDEGVVQELEFEKIQSYSQQDLIDILATDLPRRPEKPSLDGVQQDSAIALNELLGGDPNMKLPTGAFMTQVRKEYFALLAKQMELKNAGYCRFIPTPSGPVFYHVKGHRAVLMHAIEVLSCYPSTPQS